MRRRLGSWPLRLLTAATASVLAITGGAVAAAAAPTDATARIDDLSKDPAYAQFFDQTISWDTVSCADYYPVADQPAYRPYYQNSQCQTITAPKDWQDPSQGTIKVAFSVARGFDPATNTERLLFTNPGGPGGTGGDFGAILDTPRFSHINEGHAVVGVDPRGVGHSTHVSCAPTAYPADALGADGDSQNATREEIASLQSWISTDNAACANSDPGLLPFISTQQTARDFDLVRHLLSNANTKTDYYGVSYGTWLGSYIKRMFPGDFDRIVLDGNTDWTSDSMYWVFGYQAPAFQASVDLLMVPFFARHDATYHFGTTPQQVTATIATARQNVATEYEQSGGRTASPDDFDNVLVQAQYSTSSWADAADVISKASAPAGADRRAGLLALADTAEPAPVNKDNSSATTMRAVICNDTARPTDEASYIGRFDDAARYSLLGANRTIDSCAGWPYLDTTVPQEVKDRTFAGIMTDNEADPATAYEGSWRTNKEAGPDVKEIVVDNGPGHGIVTGLVANPNPCVGTPVTQYLRTGKLPASDTTCQTLPYAVRTTAGTTADTSIFEFGSKGATGRVPQAIVYDPTAKNSRHGYAVLLDRDADPSKFGSPAGKAAQTGPTPIATNIKVPTVSTEDIEANDLVVDKYRQPAQGVK